MHIIGIAVLLLSIYINNHTNQARRLDKREAGCQRLLDIRDRVLSEDGLRFHSHIINLGINFFVNKHNNNKILVQYLWVQ